jgi:hypothetical protein
MQWIDAKKTRNMKNGSRKSDCKAFARQEGRVTGVRPSVAAEAAEAEVEVEAARGCP